MNKIKILARIVFFLQIGILLILTFIWLNLFLEARHGGDTVFIGLIIIILFVATSYYFIMAFWSYVVLKKINTSYLELYLILLFSLGPSLLFIF